MVDLASSIEEIVTNIETLFRYGESSDDAERAFHDKRIENGKLFAVLSADTGYKFAPTKFAGYASNDISHADNLKERDGHRTNDLLPRLAGLPLEPSDDGYAEIDSHFLDYCQSKNIEPSKHYRPRRYWIIKGKHPFSLPEEIGSDEIWEGAKTSILVNRFERSKTAREQCLKHYGYACSACGITLEDVYGELAEQFIHVHHVVPLSMIRDDYQVDPITDLRPVCPNCHSMIHRRKDPLTIDELKELLVKCE